jgi:CheY-like chemotaxis protein
MSALEGKRILIVEDEFLLAMMLEEMLGELGCVVAGVAARPADALELLGSQKLDAAVLDVNLNGADSLPVAIALRKLGVPFIFATGYGGSRLTAEFADCPVVEKPYRLQDLSDALTQLSLASQPHSTH